MGKTSKNSTRKIKKGNCANHANEPRSYEQ